MDSNEKAKAVAALGLCCINTSRKGGVTGGICPAQFGEMAHVKLNRHPSGLHIVSCVHYAFNSTYHKCEGYDGGHVCYHAKAILIQAGNANNYDVRFSSKPAEGAIPVWADPRRMMYMFHQLRPINVPTAEKPKKARKKTVKTKK